MRHVKLIRIAVALFVVAAMVTVSEFVAEPEIIFPEIMALAVGALVAPKRTWQVSSVRMVALITISAVVGLCISRYVPWPLWNKAALAFVLCQVALPFTRTTFAPMISAAVLPVMLGTTSWIYPISASVLSAVIACLRKGMEHARLCEVEPFEPQPLPETSEVTALIARAGIGVVWVSFCIYCHVPFAAAPPLLVAFTELARPKCPARKQPWITILVVGLSAAAGVICRASLVIALGLPLTLAAVVAAFCSLMLMSVTGRYFPPAGAMATLPMLISANQLVAFPFEALVGVTILTAVALACFRQRSVQETLPSGQEASTVAVHD